MYTVQQMVLCISYVPSSCQSLIQMMYLFLRLIHEAEIWEKVMKTF